MRENSIGAGSNGSQRQVSIIIRCAAGISILIDLLAIDKERNLLAICYYFQVVLLVQPLVDGARCRWLNQARWVAIIIILDQFIRTIRKDDEGVAFRRESAEANSHSGVWRTSLGHTALHVNYLIVKEITELAEVHMVIGSQNMIAVRCKLTFGVGLALPVAIVCRQVAGIERWNRDSRNRNRSDPAGR